MKTDNRSSLQDVQSAITLVGNKDFERLQTLGMGSYGKVTLVRKRGGSDNGKLYAMKETSKHFSCKEVAIAERQILEAVRNTPFMVQMSYAFKTRNKLYLILDYLSGGDIFTRILKRAFTFSETKFYIAELILAVEHLHNLGIVHRDLKVDNLMLDRDGHIVLVDFGSAIQFPRSDERRKIKPNGQIGTLKYNAPEAVAQLEHGMPVDWWATGIIMHQLFTRMTLFQGKTDEDTIHQIMNCNPYISEDITGIAADFIRRLLEKDQEKRLGSLKGAIELKAHDFFKGFDWNLLAAKRYPPPIRPIVLYELDTNNFEKAYTTIKPEDSVGDQNSDDKRPFQNYNYST